MDDVIVLSESCLRIMHLAAVLARRHWLAKKFFSEHFFSSFFFSSSSFSFFFFARPTAWQGGFRGVFAAWRTARKTIGDMEG